MTITEQIIDTETADGPMAIVRVSGRRQPKRVLIFMGARYPALAYALRRQAGRGRL